MKTTIVAEEEGKGVAKKSTPDILLILSVTLFAIVCAISAFLFFENTRLSTSIEANKSDTAQYNSSIEKLKSDRKIIAAELVANNKYDITQTIEASEVQKYITELQDVSKKYKMMFSGFSYENGKITTSAVSVPETVLVGDDGVKKISHMIKDYRTGSGSLFELAPILSVSGYEQKRNFSLEFNLANAPKK